MDLIVNAANSALGPVNAVLDQNAALSLVVLLFGLVAAGRFALNLAGGFYAHFLRPGKDLKALGDWAIVTGGTDGIGRGYAEEFARKGLNVLVISRTQRKLDATKDEIEEKYGGVEVRTLAVDFGEFDEAARAEVAEAIDGLAVAVLVNNVGISYPFPQYFTELDDDSVAKLLSLNVDSTTWMTRLVLPGMEERKKGAVVNISSASARNPSPLLAEYAGAKGFAIHFTESLAVEYASKGISFQCQTPLYVASKLSKMRPSLQTPTPKAFARAAVARIGYEAVCSPYWVHSLMLWLLSDLLPDFATNSIVNGMHHGIRKAGFRKQARLAKEAKEGKKSR